MRRPQPGDRFFHCIHLAADGSIGLRVSKAAYWWEHEGRLLAVCAGCHMTLHERGQIQMSTELVTLTDYASLEAS